MQRCLRFVSYVRHCYRRKLWATTFFVSAIIMSADTQKNCFFVYHSHIVVMHVADAPILLLCRTAGIR
uniref:Uncharacterized protein n=1 Tax=Arundo donax TaxID=35708 RepID=A0A0A9EZD0_ARUDO